MKVIMIHDDHAIVDVTDNDIDNDNNTIIDPDIVDQEKREVDLAIELEKRGKIIVRDESKQRELINLFIYKVILVYCCIIINYGI